jgi:hypothetical protein
MMTEPHRRASLPGRLPVGTPIEFTHRSDGNGSRERALRTVALGEPVRKRSSNARADQLLERAAAIIYRTDSAVALAKHVPPERIRREVLVSLLLERTRAPLFMRVVAWQSTEKPRVQGDTSPCAALRRDGLPVRKAPLPLNETGAASGSWELLEYLATYVALGNIEPGTLPAGSAQGIVADVFAALLVMHTAGASVGAPVNGSRHLVRIAHNDLHANNIMVKIGAGGAVVRPAKLIDFDRSLLACEARPWAIPLGSSHLILALAKDWRQFVEHVTELLPSKVAAGQHRKAYQAWLRRPDLEGWDGTSLEDPRARGRLLALEERIVGAHALPELSVDARTLQKLETGF